MYPKSRYIVLSLGVILAASCGDSPGAPDLGGPVASGEAPGLRAAVVPMGSSLQLNAAANAESSDPNHPSTVTDTDSDTQLGTTDPLSVSVSAESFFGSARLLATADAAATWTDANHGRVVWNLGWVFTDVPGTHGGFALLSAIGTGDGWSYTFTADRTGSFAVDYQVTATGSNTFGMNPFNLLWYEPGVPLPSSTPLSSGTSGTITYPVTAGEVYTVRLTNNSGFFASSATTLDAQMTGSFDWSVTAAEPDRKPDAQELKVLHFSDANGNGVFDQREALEGWDIEVEYWEAEGRRRTQRCSTPCDFTLPASDGYVWLLPRAGWQLVGATVDGVQADIEVRACEPIPCNGVSISLSVGDPEREVVFQSASVESQRVQALLTDTWVRMLIGTLTEGEAALEREFDNAVAALDSDRLAKADAALAKAQKTVLANEVDVIQIAYLTLVVDHCRAAIVRMMGS